MKNKNKSNKYSINIVIIVICIILFIALVYFEKSGASESVESNVYNVIISIKSNNVTLIEKVITNLGGSIAIISICTGMLIFSKTRIKYGIPSIISVIFSWVSENLLKQIFSRERPNILRLIDETGYSFPSGHSTINFALYISLILLVSYYVRNKKVKYTLFIIFTIVPTLIAVSRIYLGVHYFCDVLAGFFLGVCIANIVYVLWKRYYMENEFTIKKLNEAN